MAMPEPSFRKHVPISAVVTAGVLGRMDVLLLLLMAMGATAIRLVAALAAKELTELTELALALELDELVLPLG